VHGSHELHGIHRSNAWYHGISRFKGFYYEFHAFHGFHGLHRAMHFSRVHGICGFHEFHRIMDSRTAWIKMDSTHFMFLCIPLNPIHDLSRISEIPTFHAIPGSHM
jgi:hypothetical protein